MFEHLQDGEQDVGAASEYTERFLSATAEDSLDSAVSEAVDEVLSEAKGDEFGDGEPLALEQSEGEVSDPDKENSKQSRLT